MTIKAGHHAPCRWPALQWQMQVIRYDVMFTDSCRYDIGKEDQGDINKLFGIGYWPHHHQNSVRFGWNYAGKDDIDIYAYWYKANKRYYKKLGSVKIGMTNTFVMMPSYKSHTLHVSGRGLGCNVPLKPQALGYHLGPYFGGNQVAPHDITIMMHKV